MSDVARQPDTAGRSAELPIALSNPLRVISPLATAALCSIMFGPPLLLADWSKQDPALLGIGTSILALSVAWLCYAGWRAPFAMRVEADRLVVRRLMREQRYGLERVRAWRFAVPDAPPTRVAPETNGVLYVTFDDGTRFRAEVTAAEAVPIARLLSAPPMRPSAPEYPSAARPR